MFNITNILVKIFAWALIFCNSVQPEIRTFSDANMGKKSHFRTWVCGSWSMVHGSRFKCNFHSSFLTRHSSLFYPFFTFVAKNAKNVWCILETFLPFCRLHAETATLWWLCSVAFPKSTPINISKKVKNEGAFAFCRKTQDGKPQQKLTSLKA